ncbi:MAG: hypothetical protein LBC19_05600 [Tannerella sp.]|nr:hypothetical protein [Tannerella sp.]
MEKRAVAFFRRTRFCLRCAPTANDGNAPPAATTGFRQQQTVIFFEDVAGCTWPPHTHRLLLNNL